jgi:hypothetical protein
VAQGRDLDGEGSSEFAVDREPRHPRETVVDDYEGIAVQEQRSGRLELSWPLAALTDSVRRLSILIEDPDLGRSGLKNIDRAARAHREICDELESGEALSGRPA